MKMHILRLHLLILQRKFTSWGKIFGEIQGNTRYCVKNQPANSPLDTVFYCKYFKESRQQHILSYLHENTLTLLFK